MFKDGRITRYGQTMLTVAFLTVVVLATVAYMFTHSPAGRDGTQAIIGVIGLGSAVVVGALSLQKGQRIEDLTHDQNEKLVEISEKAEAHPAVDALQKELANQRHTFNGVIGVILDRNAMLDTENKGLREQIALLKRQMDENATIARTLAAKVEPPQADPLPPGLGIAGQI